MGAKDKEIKELKAKNTKLREEFSSLLDGYARLELTDLRRNLQAESQKRLIDFIQRIAKRLDDDDLLDVLVEEFLLELGADRVSYILPDSGPSRRLAVSNESVQGKLKRLSLPYFISSDTDKQYSGLIYQCLDEQGLVVSKWKSAVTLVPDHNFYTTVERSFQMAMEEEFNVAQKVEVLSAMAHPIKTTKDGDMAICVQRTESNRIWSQPQRDLFCDMCRYAGMLLEQMQLNQQIRDLKDQLSSVIYSMPSAIVGIDLLGTVTMWGGRSAEFFQIPEEKILGNVFWEMVPQYHFISNAIMDVMGLEGSDKIDFEIHPFKKLDGTVVYHHAVMVNMFGSNRGELAITINDVTRQVELNQQLFHAQKMETVGTLAGGLAHDFNNVLGGIVGTLSLLKQRHTADLKNDPGNTKLQKDLEDMEIIESCTARASDMVKRLLSLSRKTVIEMEPLEINSIVDNVVTLCRASFGKMIAVEQEMPRKKFWTMGNPTQIEQAILNVCINARDAMKIGGKLTLQLSEYRVTDKFRKRFTQCSDDKLIRIKITDTGEGIPLEDLDRIFDPFFTTKSKSQGTGLGLSIVDKIIKDHGGYIDIDSKQGRGTVFSLYFIKKQAAAGPSVPIPRPIQLEKHTGDILVVDDDEMMRKTISRILYNMGYTVATAATGANAIKMCEAGLQFDLIVMDVDMPVMNGKDTCRIIRNQKPGMRVLFCTGRQHQYQIQELINQEDTWLLSKPFSAEELGHAVSISLARGKSTHAQ